MLNKILFVLLVLTLPVVGVLAIREYDEYKQQIQPAPAVEVQDTISREEFVANLQEAAAEVDKEASLIFELEAEKQRLLEYCESLNGIYDKLTPFQKTLTTRLECVPVEAE